MASTSEDNPSPVVANGEEHIDPAVTPEETKEEPMEAAAAEETRPAEVKAEKKWRAKLYQLNSEGGWDDLGTGYSHVDTKNGSIMLISENNAEYALLNSKIVMTTSYHRQRDTIITWLDDETQLDLAISFQDLDGAQETWEIICNIQGKDPDELSPEEASDEEMLPMPKHDNLTEICEEIQNFDQSRRAKIIERMYENEEAYLAKLQEVFTDLEDLECSDGLQKMFMVFKALLNISDIRLLETLLSNKYYLTTFGALEYNNEISTKHQETKHRKFLKETVKFKKFLPLDDPEVIEKIHLNYRLAYLKDTALATGLDENNMSTIVNLMGNNNSEVIQNILLNHESFAKIFERLKTDDIEVRKEAINFLSEIFSISKNLQVQGRLNLLTSFKNIEEFNLSILVRECITFKNDLIALETREKSKLDEADRMINNSLDILMSYLQSFPVTFTDLCNSKGNDESEKLLRVLTEHLLMCQSQGIKLQIHELIRFLLESDTNMTSTFYDVGFKLFAEFFKTDYKEGVAEFNDCLDFSKSLAIDIINKAIADDNYNSKMYIDKYDLIEGVNKMYNFKNKLLNIGIVKFHKALINTGFKPYVTHMIKFDYLEPVVDIFEKNLNKRNMIGSIVLELFHVIDKKAFSELAKHL
mmetsp:Transcript_25265/g.29137  ORF Transcript_25265/g.29137 Transcript_25265/m.29137 type:complete len:642 (+) Transcript_25265:1-1926(+)